MPKTALIILIILTISSPNSGENLPIPPCNPNLQTLGKVCRKKKYVRIGTLEAFILIYKSTVPRHLLRGFASCGLSWLSPWDVWAPGVGMTVFLLSSLGTWAQMTASRVERKWGKRLLHCYSRGGEYAYRILAWGLTLFVINTLADSVVEMMESGSGAWTLSLALFYGTSLPIEKGGDFRVNFCCPDVLEIEENDHYYRITMGVMVWRFKKTNVFMRLIFAILIYSALKKMGGFPVIDADTLGRALGWKDRLVFYHLFIEYQRAGNDLCAIVKKAVSAHVREVRNKALSVWLEDLSQNIEQVREKLSAKGLNVTVDTIRESLCFVDFNTLVKRLRARYCKKSDCGMDSTRLYEISERGDNYHIRFGPFHCEIAKRDRFLQIALLYVLHKVRDAQGRKVFTLEKLCAGVVNSKQRLDQLFKQYRLLADHYRDLHWVGVKRTSNEKLSARIQAIWLEDFTLQAKDVADRLVELGIVESITPERVREMAGSVEFAKIRRKLLADYKQGKYRKSTAWVMEKYQLIIKDLLDRLARGETWSKARVEKYVSELPAPVPTRHLKSPAPRPSNLAWLKCFLFNLPKSIDDKIICPECGSAETSRKSAVPEPHIVKDPKTGHTVCVHTFRFYCKNSDCSTETFSATADGSHILDEQRFAQACVMLRLVMGMRSSYRAAAKLLGVSPSTIFEELSHIARTVEHWERIIGIPRFSGTLCIDEKFVKVAELKGSSKRPFAYLFFAVDPKTGDLLHIEIFASRKQESVEAFLTGLKTRGITPEVIMTDLMSAYDSAIRNVFGREVTICKCLFHFKLNIFDHMHRQFGKKNVPELAEQLRKDIFFIVDFKSKKTIRYWYDELQKLKGRYLEREPRLLPMFECLDNYLPRLLRVIENPEVTIMTNNAAELVIRHFNQNYKLAAGFKSLLTAQRHARLFQLVYRFTPFSQDAQDDKRGRTPLELAGYDIRDMPVYQYLTEPLLFDLRPAQNLALCQKRPA